MHAAIAKTNSRDAAPMADMDAALSEKGGAGSVSYAGERRQHGMQSQEVAICTEIELPGGYKVKVCRYCRIPSNAKSPLPAGCFTAWDPLVPWSEGTRNKPRGLVCRICSVASRLSM